MSAFKITSGKKYDGAIEISVEGEDEILKNVDMLELVKQAVGPAKEDADNIMKKLDDMEGRIGTVETKVDDINKRLDRIDERLDKFLDRLDKFNHPVTVPYIQQLHDVPSEIGNELWMKWYNPDGTPKIRCGIDQAAGESWTTRVRTDGDGNVTAIESNAPHKPNVPVPTSSSTPLSFNADGPDPVPDLDMTSFVPGDMK